KSVDERRPSGRRHRPSVTDRFDVPGLAAAPLQSNGALHGLADVVAADEDTVVAQQREVGRPDGVGGGGRFVIAVDGAGVVVIENDVLVDGANRPLVVCGWDPSQRRPDGREPGMMVDADTEGWATSVDLEVKPVGGDGAPSSAELPAVAVDGNNVRGGDLVP